MWSKVAVANPGRTVCEGAGDDKLQIGRHIKGDCFAHGHISAVSHIS